MKNKFKELYNSLREKKNKILSNINPKIVIGIVIISLLSLTAFLQYQVINYNIKYNKIKQEIIDLNKKITSIKNEEKRLEDDINVNTDELNALKETLTSLEKDLETANKKLADLK